MINFGSIIKDGLSALAAPAFTYFTRKGELRQARFEAELKFEVAKGDRQAQLIREGLAADANWEMEFARQAGGSWKDEYTLLVVSIPMFLSFFKTPTFDGPGIVSEGFTALGTTPTWYQIVLISIFLATYGIRYWRRSQSDT
jgi:hypothetical protein